MKRTLSLRREALTELTTDELASFRGAGPTDPQPTPPWYVTHTLSPKDCLATTQDSAVVCSGDCMTRGTTCAC